MLLTRVQLQKKTGGFGESWHIEMVHCFCAGVYFFFNTRFAPAFNHPSIQTASL